MDLTTLIIVLIITVIISIIRFYKNAFKHWEKLNIPFDKPSIPFGNQVNPLAPKESPGEVLGKVYQKAKDLGHKHFGYYTLYKPMYVPIDLELIRCILSKDFNHFVDRGIYHNKKVDPLSASLLAIEGDYWRNLRAKLTPTFSSGKMKMMFPILVECGENLKLAMEKFTSTTEPVNIKDVLGCYTTDVIGSAAFGLDCNSFTDPNSDFRKFGKKAVIDRVPRLLKQIFSMLFPNFSHKINLRVTDDDVTEFFLNIVKETVEYREKNNVKRKDFLQLLIELRNDSSDYSDNQKVMKGLTMEELAAQAFIFFIAGYETSSTTLMFILYELAINPHIQEKVRDEINEVFEKHQGNFTYDCLMELKYMKQVLDETLRKYPPLTILFRTCVEDYKIPDTDITLEKNTTVFIPIMGLHYDPEYFPDPDVFDPERFSDENKHKVVPFTYLPFGDGPRACIGVRFGVMQVKIGLVLLLKNYSFSLNAKTKTPLKLSPANFLIAVLGDIWLNVEKI